MKKILSMLSLFAILTSSSSLTVSCNSKITSKVKEEENYIINAINTKKGTPTNPVKITDILKVKKITPSISKENMKLSYDIEIKKDANTFLQKHNLVPEVRGSFTYNITTKKIDETSNTYTVTYQPN